MTSHLDKDEGVRMRIIVLIIAMAVLVGCGSKSTVQKWRGSKEPLPTYNGPVCLLPGPLPENIEFTFLGRAVANQQQYGGYAKVNATLADVARSVGADTVFDLQSKQKIGFFVVVRPQSWGMAARLKSPELFDCISSGGRVYPEIGMAPTSRATSTAVAPSQAGAYDECMVRVMRISDSALRLKAMAACDDVQ